MNSAVQYLSHLPLLALCAILLGPAGLARAAPGDLDPSFDEDGRVFVDIAGDSDIPATVIQQSDGKLVVGRSNDAADDDFSVLRFNVDGSLDASFDGDGRTSLDYPGIKGTTQVVLQQTDGKIVAAGTARNTADSEGTNLGLARYNEDGSVDFTFGVEGVVIHDLGGWDSISSIVQQADGRLVVAGSSDGGDSSTLDMAFARFNIDGTLDRSFGTNGAVIINFHGSSTAYDYVSWLVQQPDGKLIAAGAATPSNPYSTEDMALVRLTPDGSLDTTFDSDGRAIVETESCCQLAAAQTLLLETNGRIVVAGSGNFSPWDYGFCDPILGRLSADGGADTTFGTDGTVWLDLGCADIQGLAMAADGGFYVTGPLYDSIGTDHFVARVSPAGELDPAFGDNGVSIVDVGEGSEVANAGYARQGVIRQHDGKIVTVTSTSTGDERSRSDRLVVARLLESGDFAGLLGLKPEVIEVNESTGSVMVTVRRTGGSYGVVSVDYMTMSGSATSGVDFTGTNGTLIWTDGDTADKTIEISIAADTQSEDPENFAVTLSKPSGGAGLATSEIRVRILDGATGTPDSPSPPSSSPPSRGGGGTIDWPILLMLTLGLLREPSRFHASRIRLRRRGSGPSRLATLVAGRLSTVTAGSPRHAEPSSISTSPAPQVRNSTPP